MLEFEFDGKRPIQEELDLGNLSDNDTRVIRFIFPRFPDDTDLSDSAAALHINGLGIYSLDEKHIFDNKIQINMPVTTAFTAKSGSYKCSFKFLMKDGTAVWTTDNFRAVVSDRTDENNRIAPTLSPDIVDAAITAAKLVSSLKNIDILSDLSDIDGNLGYKNNPVTAPVNFWLGTRDEYNALPPDHRRDPDKIHFIKDGT